MPKIPVYTSQAMPTTNTGMVTYSRAQIDSRPFIQAALKEGEMAATAAATISSYLDGRIRAEGDLAANQALMGAEAAMQSEVSRLSRAPNPSKVFGPDLADRDSWNGSIRQIQSALQESLSPYAQRQFGAKFGAMSAQYGAQLRVKTDERTDAMLVGDVELATQNFALTYGNINSETATKANLDFAGELLAVRYNNLVATGRMSADDAQLKIRAATKDIAETALTLFFNEHPAPLTAYQQLISGDAAQLLSLAGSHKKGEYVLSLFAEDGILKDKGVRADIIDKMRQLAHDQYSLVKSIEADDAKRLKAANTGLLNSLFEDGISEEEFEAGLKILEDQDFITPQMQKLLADLDEGTPGLFRTKDEGDVDETVREIERFVGVGLLTYDQLSDEASNLTQETFRSFMNDVGSIRKDVWSDMAKQIGIEFGYAEERAGDIEEYEQAAQLAYRRANRTWNRYKRENPQATSKEMQAELDRIIDDNWKQLDLVLSSELKLTLDAMSQDNQGLSFPMVNGKYDLQAVLPTLSAYIQSANRPDLGVNVMELQYFIDMMGDR
ncbi:hypothetical protein N9E91_04290 [Alphaproteobacteria bacterium]|nr:hypothetical protein [Alphaproteobacteria bacterium]